MSRPDEPRPREVWVQLVDERTCRAFADMSTQLVTLPEDAECIAEVSQAVQGMYNHEQPEGTNHLAQVPSVLLMVYENREAYLTKKEAFRGDEDIGDYGESMETLLVVEVAKERFSVALNEDNELRRVGAMIEYSCGNTDGIPSDFRSYRADTVKRFYDLLFPDEEMSYLPLLLVSAPPMSGKTAMLHLMNNYIRRTRPKVRVAFLQADRMKPGETISKYFSRLYKRDLEQFCENGSETVVLIDEDQITYNDRDFWIGIVKYALWQRYRARFVMFCSYGCEEVVSWSRKWRSPLKIPREGCITLNSSLSKPGLRLSLAELEDMACSCSLGKGVCDSVLQLGSGHAGITRAILSFLRDEEISEEDDELRALHSEKLIEYICHTCRGIPTVAAVDNMIKTEKLSGETVKRVLDDVASGVMVGSSPSISDTPEHY